MKQSAVILENIGMQPSTIASRALTKTISLAISNGIDYTLMTTMLEECQMPTDLPSAQAITIKKSNKTKILDRHKLICRVITQAMKMTTSSDVNSQDSFHIFHCSRQNKERYRKRTAKSKLQQTHFTTGPKQHIIDHTTRNNINRKFSGINHTGECRLGKYSTNPSQNIQRN